MRRIILFIFAFSIFHSCKKNYHPREINFISIKEFKIDSTSIRAIQIIDKDNVAYASDNGQIGFFGKEENSIIMTIKCDASKIWSYRILVFWHDY